MFKKPGKNDFQAKRHVNSAPSFPKTQQELMP
jgi:hypothetical protein